MSEILLDDELIKNEEIKIKNEINITNEQQSSIEDYLNDVDELTITAPPIVSPITTAETVTASGSTSSSSTSTKIRIKTEQELNVTNLTSYDSSSIASNDSNHNSTGNSYIINNDDKNSSSSREARNRAEKNRRDKLNGSIQDLASMVPHVAESPRRVDKTAVLRFSAHGLRINYVFGKSVESPHRKTHVNNSSTEHLLKLLDSFLLTVTCRGQIVLVSSSVEQYLGHCQTDLFGQNILNFTHPDDHAIVKRELIPTDLQKLFNVSSDPDDNLDTNGEPKERTQEQENEIDLKLKKDRRRFIIRFARAGPRTEPTTYETLRFDGCFRRADSAPRGFKTTNYPAGLQLIRRSRSGGRDDIIPLNIINGNDIVLVAMVNIIKPPSISRSILEICKFEYKTRHLIDGSMVDCDQRISIVAGYMNTDVIGLSPFAFMHKDDVRWVMVALRQMYDFSNQYGESCYRLMARNGQFIYLKTRGYLEIDENQKVHTFVCINTLVDDETGKRLVREMKKKYAVIIQENSLRTQEVDVPAVENPHQIERAILNLITNLHSRNDTTENYLLSPSDSHCSSERYDMDLHHHQYQNIKSPSLAIIAPEPCTVKTSVKKSVKIIVTASKGMNKNCNNNISNNNNDNSNSNNISNNNNSNINSSNSGCSNSTSSSRYSNVIHNDPLDYVNINESRPSVLQRNQQFSPNIPHCHQQQQLPLSLPSSSKITHSTVPETQYSSVVTRQQQPQPPQSETLTSVASPLSTKSTIYSTRNRHKYHSNNSLITHSSDDSEICGGLIQIKEEPLYDNRIPPLPSNMNYFSDIDYSNPSNFITSPMSEMYDRHPSYSRDYTMIDNSNSNNIMYDHTSGMIRTSSALKRTRNYCDQNIEGGGVIGVGSNVDDCNENNIMMKRLMQSNPIKYETNPRTQMCLEQLTNPSSDLNKALPYTFQVLECSLDRIEKTTSGLRDQYNNRQIDELIDEQREQRNMLYAIQQEYNELNELNQSINNIPPR